MYGEIISVKFEEEAAVVLEKKIVEEREHAAGLEMEIGDIRLALEEAEGRSERHLEDKKEYKANILTTQEHMRELTGERDRLRRELTDIKESNKLNEDEWRQFQSDLQARPMYLSQYFRFRVLPLPIE